MLPLLAGVPAEKVIYIERGSESGREESSKSAGGNIAI
jgi:hypothetical protein